MEVSIEQSMPTSQTRSLGFRSLIGQNSKKSGLAGNRGAPSLPLQFMMVKMLENSIWRLSAKGV